MKTRRGDNQIGNIGFPMDLHLAKRNGYRKRGRNRMTLFFLLCVKNSTNGQNLIKRENKIP